MGLVGWVDLIAQHRGGDDMLLRDRCWHLGRGSIDSAAQSDEHRVFVRAAIVKVVRVDASGLTDPIDAANPLFEPNRIPRQFQIENEATPRLQIQTFACRIGCKENARFATNKSVDRLTSFARRHGAVERRQRDARRQARFECGKGVAILAEHNCRFRRAT